MRLIDGRAARFEQAVVVVVLLAGFAATDSRAIPIATVIAALGAVMGERSPTARLWSWVQSRRKTQPVLEPATVSLRQAGLVAAGLVIATFVWLLGASTIASLIAAGVAVIAALGATNLWTAATELGKRRPKA